MALWKFLFGKKKDKDNIEKQETEIKNEESKTEEQETEIKNEESKVEEQKTEIRNEESKVEEQETEIRNEESKVEGQETKIRNEESKVEEQETKIRNEESKVEEQETEIRNEESKVEEQENQEKKESWFKRLRDGLSKTRSNFTYRVRKIFNFGNIDEDTLEELEELFIQSDIGTDLTFELIEKIERGSVNGKINNSDEVIAFLKEEFKKILNSGKKEEIKEPIKEPMTPSVTLVVGVNGVGKTTTIGKLAYHLKNNGNKVMLIAGDTFRAAAIEQLEIWADRSKCQLIKHSEGSDSAAVVFDGINSGLSKNMDCIIVDTAGRLHNKVNLMKELEKIKRVIKKAREDIEIETLLVIDSTSGQNGLIQAKTFKQAVDIDGIVLTKMDGTAKGGIILPIVRELGVSVNFIGVGEGIEDLRYFEADDFVDALFD